MLTEERYATILRILDARIFCTFSAGRQRSRRCSGASFAGLGTPTIMVMGPTDANRNGPYGQLENAIEVPRSCKYCWKRACPKGFDCLDRITPAMVEEKLKFLC